MRWMQAVKRKITKERATSTERDAGATAASNSSRHAAMLGRLKWIALGVLIVGLLAGWGLAEQRLGQYVADTQTQPLVPGNVQLVDAPEWMPAWLRQELTTLVAGQAGSDPLDEQGLERALMALRMSPWVARVERVDRGAGIVRVFAQYRKPTAWVRGDDGYRIVDAQGVHLPFHRQLSRVRLPVIEGVSARPPRPGQLWPGDQVKTGLAMMAALADYPFANQIAALGVDVSSAHGQRIGIVLWTGAGRDMDHDPHVEWGRAPGREQAIEPAATTKLQWLTMVQQTYHSIDAGGKIVNVCGPAATWRDPSGDQLAQSGYTWKR